MASTDCGGACPNTVEPSSAANVSGPHSRLGIVAFSMWLPRGPRRLGEWANDLISKINTSAEPRRASVSRALTAPARGSAGDAASSGHQFKRPRETYADANDAKVATIGGENSVDLPSFSDGGHRSIDQA